MEKKKKTYTHIIVYALKDNDDNNTHVTYR